MILDKREINFLKDNQEIIQNILSKRIDDFKDKVINTEDEEKRDNLIRWVKEMNRFLILIRKINDYKIKDTGI
jgi:hypothetical protein